MGTIRTVPGVRRGPNRLAPWACAALFALSTGCSGGGGGGVAADPGGGADPGPGADPGAGGSPGGNGDATEAVRVLATAGQAVSWMDAEYATYGFLPPHAVVRAQVVKPDGGGGKPELLNDTQVSLFYEAVDVAGSINSKSLRKTDLWEQPAGRLFGVDLVPGRGIFGLAMPADASTPGRQPLSWKSDGWFVADGIPITPIDDGGAVNELPRLRIVAVDRVSGLDLGHVDVTVPVSQVAGCVVCHATGALGTRRPGMTWSGATNLERQSRENVLLLHDAMHATSLATTKPASCSLCHFTRANDLTGWGSSPDSGWAPPLSRALHGAHAALLGPTNAPIFPPAGTAAETCARCHVSSHASRGAMAKSGLDCIACHGSLAAVAGTTPLAAGGSRDGTRDGALRRPFTDEPRCESCHIGDAVSRTVGPQHVLAPDGLRLAQAFATGDAAASPIRRDGTRFAPAPATPFHLGKGHGGLRCEACHGGAHAEWSRDRGEAFDAALATRYQGHAGTMVECSTCHPAGTLPLNVDGPHGMHNVGDVRWAAGGHASFRAANPASCEACHGKDLAGTVLSRAAAERTYALPGRSVTIPKGQTVGCGMCHATHDTSVAWISGAHGAAYDAAPAGCKTCHGTDLAGTGQSTASVDRTYAVISGTYRIPAGTQVGCALCHVPHATTLAWVDGGHGSSYASNTAGCAICHGSDGKGSSMSVAAAARSYTVNGRTFSIASGAKVGCATCHVPHATTSTWVTSTHGPLYESTPGDCTSCHGTDLKGTLLTKTAAARSYTFGKKTVSFTSGETVTCAKCHVAHATTSTFVGGHDNLYENDPVACKMCHGSNLTGTSFSVAAADRSYSIDGKTVTIKQGTKVPCTLCHSKP